MKKSKGFAFIGLLITLVILAALYSVFLKTLSGDGKAARPHDPNAVESIDVKSCVNLGASMEGLKSLDKNWKHTEKKIDELSK